MAADTIRIGSYNILVESDYTEKAKPSLRGMPWTTRCEALVGKILEMNVAIVCLQEVNQFDSLAEKMASVGYHGIMARRNNGEQEGCATFFKHQVVQPTAELSHFFNDGTGRMVQQVTFQVLGKKTAPFNVLNTHIAYDDKYRKGENDRAVEIALDLANKTQLPLFVCGDFNITAQDMPYVGKWNTSGFTDALAVSPNWHKPTFMHGEHPMRIDYIWHMNTPGAITADVYGDPRELHNPKEPSDHLRIVEEFPLL